jgi:hypothetical protein
MKRIFGMTKLYGDAVKVHFMFWQDMGVMASLVTL